MRTKIVVLVITLLMALTACGGDPPDPTPTENPDPMAAIDEALADIDSGRIHIVIRANSPGAPPIAFEMSGTFSEAADKMSLPIADLKYSNRSGAEPQDSSFISDGERAWVVNEIGTKEVEGERLAGLRGGGDVVGLAVLNPRSWFKGDPQESEGEPVDGEPTTSYTGEVDALAMIEDIISVSSNLGALAAEKIPPDRRDQIRDAAQNATLEVVAGTEDRLLRTVKFGVDIAGDTAGLAPVLRQLAANRIEFELSLSEINGTFDPPPTPEGAEI